MENIIINKTKFHSSNKLVLFSTFSISPRYYYNLAKRDANTLDILNNSGNFVSLTFRFYPEALALSKEKNITGNSYGYIIPTWGIRRNLSCHLSYEMDLGLGLNANIENGNPFKIQSEFHIRFGYHFL